MQLLAPSKCVVLVLPNVVIEAFSPTVHKHVAAVNQKIPLRRAFLRSKVMCMYVHMSAASHYGSPFVYLFLACSWSFLFEPVWTGTSSCTLHIFALCFLSRRRIFANRSVAAVTEDVPVNLDPHVCSPRYRLPGRGSSRCEIWKFLPSSKHLCASRWKPIRLAWCLVFKGKLPLLTDGGEGPPQLCSPATPLSVSPVRLP